MLAIAVLFLGIGVITNGLSALALASAVTRLTLRINELERKAR